MFTLPSLRTAAQNEPAEVTVWYDRGCRSWVIQTLTDDGCQVGNVEHRYAKADAVARGKAIAAELGVSFHV